MTHKTWDQLIEYLKTVDHPRCFTVNYLPDNNEYELWIGNQPYYNYEELIELEQKEKHELHSKLDRVERLLDDVFNDHECSLSIREMIEEYDKESL
jgi:hypothetical protein